MASFLKETSGTDCQRVATSKAYEVVAGREYYRRQVCGMQKIMRSVPVLLPDNQVYKLVHGVAGNKFCILYNL